MSEGKLREPGLDNWVDSSQVVARMLVDIELAVVDKSVLLWLLVGDMLDRLEEEEVAAIAGFAAVVAGGMDNLGSTAADLTFSLI
jgi:hypothetical protein